MDWVVSYDHPIDNKEEMKMKTFRIKDVCDDYADVKIFISGDDKFVTLDFDPLVETYTVTMMQYTPEEARKLAAALILAADEAELPAGKGKTVKTDFTVADELTKNSKFC